VQQFVDGRLTQEALVKVYFEDEIDITAIRGERIAIIGYGNQGRAQGMNLRDSGLHVHIGTLNDASWKQAEAGGFGVFDVGEAVRRADMVLLLVPDQVQAELYRDAIAPNLSAGKLLGFAHGYNIYYGLIQPPPDVDVVMVAPRMIGVKVRELYLAGSGAPAYVAVHQDATGRAWARAMGLAAGIGAAKGGAIEQTFAQETELDLFCEQFVWAAITRTLIGSFEFLVAEGYDPEVAVLELYASGEAGEVVAEMARTGFFKQMHFHSNTSQYGTLSRGPEVFPESIRETMRAALDVIRGGAFAREWSAEQEAGYPVFRRLWREAEASAMQQAEAALHRSMRLE
jgi:ketol-acid reductoisomerase